MLLTKRSFKDNFFRVAQANIAAQLLLIVASPLLTRLYNPELFGVAAIFTAILQITLAFVTWRFDWSIPNANTDKTAAAVFLAGIGSIFGSLALIIFVCSQTPTILTYFDITNLLGTMIWFLPVALLGSAPALLLQGWFVRAGDLAAVSKTKVYQSIGTVVVSITLGYFGFGAAGLILGSVVGCWLGLWTLAVNSGSLLSNVQQLSYRDILFAVTQFGKEASISTLVSVLNAASMASTVLMLSLVYTATEVGLAALMLRLAAAPIGVLNSSIAQSFWAKSADLSRNNEYLELSKLYRRVTKLLAAACIPIMIVCLSGPFYAAALFGEQWRDAGLILACLLPMLSGMLMFSSTNHLIVFGRQDLQLVADGLRIFLMLVAIVLASVFELVFSQAILIFSFASLVGHMTLFSVHLYIHKELINNHANI